MRIATIASGLAGTMITATARVAGLKRTGAQNDYRKCNSTLSQIHNHFPL
jgi:hypothetical protein